MKIDLNENRQISALQEQFNQEFRYLKIEFFRNPHLACGGSLPEDRIDPEKHLHEVRQVVGKGELEITPQTTVAEMESKFRLLFGLNVQVFRKAGKAWLETTATDSWTLEKQNQFGQEASGAGEETMPPDYSLRDVD
jgi:hypothetical protein